ncbi:NAD(P)/FAD-dependent oxidoreductase [Kribbella sp. NPDC051620]|uniref:NAD(P)/FAD-dependent oxidoreductase n=1 Tax=Kribbella sp. NPDC051620 TaxID=3364120 RepID=UPI0037B0088A
MVIVGGGPSGLAAALTLSRARRTVLVIDEGKPRNSAATAVNGVPGFSGLRPQELLAQLRREAGGYGMRYLPGRVAGVRRPDDATFVVTTEPAEGSTAGSSEVQAAALVIATGVRDFLPKVPGLGDAWGTRVLPCAYCDGAEVASTRVGVLGVSPKWGQSVETAQLLRQFSDDVCFLQHEAAELTPLELSALQARGIRHVDTTVESVAQLESGELELVLTGREVLRLDYLFVDTVTRPSSAFPAALGVEQISTRLGPAPRTAADGSTGIRNLWITGSAAVPNVNIPTAVDHGYRTGVSVNSSLIDQEISALVPGWDA